METIVVGIDGSPGAQTALELAANEAAVRKARLRIVTVYDVAAAAYAGGFVPPVDMTESLQAEAEQVALRAVSTAEALQPSIYVEHEVLQGYAAEVLVRESAHASLVVVGSRGHGGFASLLLGSVSHQVAQHARCPVMIVPKPRAAEEAKAA
jgi:nucleotide-binding universal stress UspA family protein